MERLTVKTENGHYALTGGDHEQMIERLGLFEDAYTELMKSRAQIPKELEALRTQGKEKTVTYKETLAQKLMNGYMIQFFERHGLK